MLLLLIWIVSICGSNANEYGKSPKIECAKVADKMAYANSVDPDQTAPEVF